MSHDPSFSNQTCLPQSYFSRNIYNSHTNHDSPTNTDKVWSQRIGKEGQFAIWSQNIQVCPLSSSATLVHFHPVELDYFVQLRSGFDCVEREIGLRHYALALGRGRHAWSLCRLNSYVS